MKQTGIYKITNTVNGKVYVGSAIDINHRCKDHFRDLENNKHHSIKLQRSFIKHGGVKFVFNVIEECVKEDLIKREQYWINYYDSYCSGYNCTPTAGSNYGKKFSEEAKKNMSISHLGKKRKPFTIETLKKMSDSQKGRPSNRKGKKLPLETIIKMKESHKGKIISEEQREKLRQHNLGKKHSEETKKKMRESQQKRRDLKNINNLK